MGEADFLDVGLRVERRRKHACTGGGCCGAAETQEIAPRRAANIKRWLGSMALFHDISSSVRFTFGYVGCDRRSASAD
jgi:hypothetical protein